MPLVLGVQLDQSGASVEIKTVKPETVVYGLRRNFKTTEDVTKDEKHKLTCSRIGLLQSYETYSRIGLLRSYGNLQSYWITTNLWKLTIVLNYYKAMETYRRIGLLQAC
jgi:hypothetical protein